MDGAVLEEDGAGGYRVASVQENVPGPRFSLNRTVLANYVTQLDYQVANVTVNGAKGRVELKVLYQGAPVALGGDHEPEYWLYDDGQWWLESSRYWMDEKEREGEGCVWGRWR